MQQGHQTADTRLHHEHHDLSRPRAGTRPRWPCSSRPWGGPIVARDEPGPSGGVNKRCRRISALYTIPTVFLRKYHHRSLGVVLPALFLIRLASCFFLSLVGRPVIPPITFTIRFRRHSSTGQTLATPVAFQTILGPFQVIKTSQKTEASWIIQWRILRTPLLMRTKRPSWAPLPSGVTPRA